MTNNKISSDANQTTHMRMQRIKLNNFRIIRMCNSFSSHFSHRSGFTLIELLVVIAIAAVISTILMVNFNGIRERNRDTRRKADLKEIQTAFELYRSDLGFYPDSVAPVDPTGNVLFPTTCGTASSPVPFTSAGGTVYMRNIPCDPSTNLPYTYSGLNGNLNYTLSACLENARDSDKKVVSGSTVFCASPYTARPVFEVTNP